MKKLSISKETLRKLDDGTLMNVAGGKNKPQTVVAGCFMSNWKAGAAC